MKLSDSPAMTTDAMKMLSSQKRLFGNSGWNIGTDFPAFAKMEGLRLGLPEFLHTLPHRPRHASLCAPAPVSVYCTANFLSASGLCQVVHAVRAEDAPACAADWRTRIAAGIRSSSVPAMFICLGPVPPSAAPSRRTGSGWSFHTFWLR